MKRLSILQARPDTWRLAVVVATVAATLNASPATGGSLIFVLLQLAAIGVGLASILRDGRLRVPRSTYPLILAVSAFCAMALASTTWSVAPQTTLLDATTTLIMMTFLVLSLLGRWHDRRVLLGDTKLVFWTVCGLQGSALTAGLVGVDLVFDPDYGRFRGWLSNANYAGMASVFGVGARLGLGLERTKPLGRATAGGSVLLLVALALSESRGTALALAVGVVIFVLPRLTPRRAAVILATGILVPALTFAARISVDAMRNETGTVGPAQPSAGAPGGEGPFSRDPETDISSGRFELYANLFGSIADRPVLGSGYRTTELLPAMQGSGGHNLLLSVTAELGIMGIFWFLAVILVLISGSFLPKSYTAAAALLTGVTIVGVSELTESSILGWGSPTTLLAWLLIFVAAVPLVGPTSEETR